MTVLANHLTLVSIYPCKTSWIILICHIQRNRQYQNVRSIPSGLYKPGVHIGCFSSLLFVALQSLRLPQVMITWRGRQPGSSLWLDANLHHLNDTQKGSSVTLGARSLSTFTKKKGSSLPHSYLRGKPATRKSKEIHVDILGVFWKKGVGTVNYQSS